jgi:hypothetical protein
MIAEPVARLKQAGPAETVELTRGYINATPAHARNCQTMGTENRQSAFHWRLVLEIQKENST